MGFWVASADASGNRIGVSEEQLILAPVEVEYPTTQAGRTVETAGGAVVQQFPTKDPRRRGWIWQNLPNYSSQPRYFQLIHRLESLVSITRRARGLSPWVWFKDTDTDEFRIQHLDQGTATAATTTTLTDSAKLWIPDIAKHGTLEIVSGTGVGQRRTVLSNTGQQLTLNDPWTITPVAGSTYSVQYSEPAWIRVRVLNVSKDPSARGGVSYETVRVEFVVDDPNWNAFGYQLNTTDVVLDYDPGDAGGTFSRASTATYVLEA